MRCTPDDPSQSIFLALREFLGSYPKAAVYSSEALARLLEEGRYLAWRPADHEVEEALEALRDNEGEILA